MAKYVCKYCKNKREIRNETLIVVEGKIITKEAKCECGKYMEEETKEKFNGFPTIIRNESTK
tara:strand:+ start:968 stop:1153 length:186 start_codon:yes stop_codon:yes gene_type:complete